MWVDISITNSQGTRGGEDVLMFIRDATKFVKMFSGIIDESTPHLYLSALPFLPSNSIMARSLLDRFPGIAKVVVGQPCDWPGSLTQVIRKHQKWVTAVAFSPDGRHIVSGSADCTIQLWDAQTAVQVGNLIQGHTSPVESVAFSPDGRYIVSGSSDSTIKLWDAQSGGQVGNTFQRHTFSAVMSVAFSPDGTHIVSGSKDSTIQLWDVQTGRQMGNPLQGHTSSVNSVAFSPDGRYIVSGSSDRKIQLWDAQTGRQAGNPFQGHASPVNSVAFSPDGRYIVSGSDNCTIQLWDTQTGDQVGSLFQGHTSRVRSVAFSLDGRHIISGSNDKTIRLWDAQTGNQVQYPFQGHTSSVWSVAFSSDGRHIVSGSSDNTIRLWDVQTGCQTGNPLQKNLTDSVEFPPDDLSSHIKTMQLHNGHRGGSTTSSLQVERLKWGSTFVAFPLRSLLFPMRYALNKPQYLAPNSPNIMEDCLEDLGYLQDDGWIVGPNNELLLWVPLSYHLFFYYTSWTRLVIPKGTPQLDLSRMAHGSAWCKCYSSIQT